MWYIESLMCITNDRRCEGLDVSRSLKALGPGRSVVAECRSYMGTKLESKFEFWGI